MKTELREWLSWLEQSSDAQGECDECLAENKPLWRLPAELDTEQEANWMYCRACFREIVTRKAGA